MPLNASQRQNAQLIYSTARSRGLSPQRSLELVNAAYAESGLDPKNYYGRSAGKPFIPGKTAGGLFELLSRGYVSRAQRMGGVLNARANTNAIIGDYVNYWRSHPGAAPGQAAAAVERSGEGAGFYSGALGMLSGAVGNVRGSSLGAPPGAAVPGPTSAAPGANPRAALASALIAANQASSRGQPADYSQFASLVSAARQPAVPQAPAQGPEAGLIGVHQRGGINELFYDPLGAIKGGKSIAPVGGHGDHVHVALTSLQAQLAAENEARQLGLRVGQEQNADVTRVHTPTSYHYRNFPGSKYRQAADISGDARRMAAFFKWVARNYR